jgi:TDG/mug DNA glycosylase family protein
LTDILPDVLAPDLRLIVCGSAAGTKSAQVGAYYAGPGNRFWPTLHAVGLTPVQLAPQDFRSVLAYGIGLTDIAKKAFGGDSTLQPADFDADRLRARIEMFRPRILAFNGKNAAKRFFGGTVAYGWQTDRSIGATRIFVAPSTSGAARGFWSEAFWRELAEAVLAP